MTLLGFWAELTIGRSLGAGAGGRGGVRGSRKGDLIPTSQRMSNLARKRQ